MLNLLLLGGGKIGQAITAYLNASANYTVTVADIAPNALSQIASQNPTVKAIQADVTNRGELTKLMAGRDAVISALSYMHNPLAAEVALDTGASYFDLTEDIGTTRAIQRVAAKARPGQVFMPQCGLAPGFVGIVGYDLAQQFDQLVSCRMRVGALPKYPTNMLKYNLTWSTDGLINEYCNPCEAIINGRSCEAQALEGVETFSMDGTTYEAFNTSGGLGTLCETLKSRTRSLDYKTIRYVGHRQLAHFLINELRMRDDRDNLKAILERSVPMTIQDVVIIFVTATGYIDGRFVQRTDARKVYHGVLHGREWSAIQITTAAGICAAVELHRQGKLPRSGFVRQEQVALADFFETPFGRYYSLGEHEGVKVERFTGNIENEPA